MYNLVRKIYSNLPAKMDIYSNFKTSSSKIGHKRKEGEQSNISTLKSKLKISEHKLIALYLPGQRTDISPRAASFLQMFSEASPVVSDHNSP